MKSFWLRDKGRGEREEDGVKGSGKERGKGIGNGIEIERGNARGRGEERWKGRRKIQVKKKTTRFQK